MTYYRIKEKYDQRKRKDGSIIIASELYTEKEIEKFSINPDFTEKISLPKNQIYWSFGARFAI